MAIRSGIPGKRLSYVEDTLGRSSNLEDPSSSSSDSGESTNYKSKVRNNNTLKQFPKKINKFMVDTEDMFTSVKLQLKGNLKSRNSVKNSTRKKRKMSSESEGNLSKDRCLSRNAINARLNRERKKEYMKSIEVENKSLKNENSELKKINDSQNKSISQLKHEISYLKNVLANSKELCVILESIKSTGLPVKARFPSSNSKRVDEFEGSSSHEEELREMFFKDEDCNPTNSAKFVENFSLIDDSINLGKIEHDFILSDLENLSDHDKNDLFSKNFINEPFPEKIFESGYSNFEEADKTSKGGICLHVNNKSISVEFCHICNENST